MLESNNKLNKLIGLGDINAICYKSFKDDKCTDIEEKISCLIDLFYKYKKITQLDKKLIEDDINSVKEHLEDNKLMEYLFKSIRNNFYKEHQTKEQFGINIYEKNDRDLLWELMNLNITNWGKDSLWEVIDITNQKNQGNKDTEYIIYDNGQDEKIKQISISFTKRIMKELIELDGQEIFQFLTVQLNRTKKEYLQKTYIVEWLDSIKAANKLNLSISEILRINELPTQDIEKYKEAHKLMKKIKATTLFNDIYEENKGYLSWFLIIEKKLKDNGYIKRDNDTKNGNLKSHKQLWDLNDNIETKITYQKKISLKYFEVNEIANIRLANGTIKLICDYIDDTYISEYDDISFKYGSDLEKITYYIEISANSREKVDRITKIINEKVPDLIDYCLIQGKANIIFEKKNDCNEKEDKDDTVMRQRDAFKKLIEEKGLLEETKELVKDKVKKVKI